MLSFQETSILNKFCFPWWFYPCFGLVKWCLSWIIIKIGYGFDDILKEQPLLLKQNKKSNVFNILIEIPEIPPAIANQILSYIDFEISRYEIAQHFYNKRSFKIFSRYLIIYAIVDVFINVYCWYMAINHWINAFKIERNGWNRYLLLSFDSLFILPSHIDISMMIHYYTFLYIISKKLEYYSQYYSKWDLNIRKYILGLMCFILGILKVTPFIIAIIPAFYSIIVPGIFIAFPVTLITIICGMCAACPNFVYKAGKGREFINILCGIAGFIASYGILAIIFTTTVCVYNGNKWGECLRYGVGSQYCPTFNFDYTSFDSWIWIMKWTYF